ncbi:uncharacterized protein BDR25DRAFT_395056 [Lindgomyces ingoldianus]|uniref:Uncharacterized protein n=1 Tax=Lindgomyces ingoldianus TaxID=673940 RepID=A0ACB6QLT1_9PLEO|nr:uncharacterized protein BDR25DRAFT_395056 [Lindgomyces ingoldianus]KAF2467850.1 hypothetical protein BDR25DRAFT_395056 [Lindgomyces ingoldianus]
MLALSLGPLGVGNALYLGCIVVALLIGIVSLTGGGGGLGILARTLLGLNGNKPLPLHPARIFILRSKYSNITRLELVRGIRGHMVEIFVVSHEPALWFGD